MHAFGLACLNDLAGQEVHEDVEQEGGERSALPHTSADAETLQLDPLPRHPHPVTLVEVLDEAYQLGVDSPCLQHFPIGLVVNRILLYILIELNSRLYSTITAAAVIVRMCKHLMYACQYAMEAPGPPPPYGHPLPPHTCIRACMLICYQLSSSSFSSKRVQKINPCLSTGATVERCL